MGGMRARRQLQGINQMIKDLIKALELWNCSTSEGDSH